MRYTILFITLCHAVQDGDILMHLLRKDIVVCWTDNNIAGAYSAGLQCLLLS